MANGRIVDARRTTRGQNRRATVRVRPSSDAAMTLTLSPAADCASADSICTADGRPLSASVAATVAGPGASPPALAVADASADEGGALSFAVTLDAAASGTVTVDWATSDGTATAGQDYTAGSGTLAFAPGETSKTVSVATLADRVFGRRGDADADAVEPVGSDAGRRRGDGHDRGRGGAAAGGGDRRRGGLRGRHAVVRGDARRRHPTRR